ncbi:MAG: UbiD family decarboxylase, partial [Candidatus Bathyarchaeia archaeon]
MGLREFLKQLEQEGQLTRIKKEVSTDLEMAGIIDALGEKPCYFENVKESSLPVVAGLVSSKAMVAKALNMDVQQILPKLSRAIENPEAPEVV